MHLNSDFRDFIKLLNTHSVKYLLIGAFVRAYYGRPRYTGDMDIFIEASPENADSMMYVISDFGFGETGLTRHDFISPDQTIQLGNEPRRIDILTGITAIEFKDAWENRVTSEIDGVPVYILHRDDYIKNKRALGRNKDLADIDEII